MSEPVGSSPRERGALPVRLECDDVEHHPRVSGEHSC